MQKTETISANEFIKMVLKPYCGQMKKRRHTNTKGLRQIKNGSTHYQVKVMADRLNLPHTIPLTNKRSAGTEPNRKP